MPPYKFGDIVQVVIPDPNAVNPKSRPSVVLQITPAGIAIVAAITSSSIPDPLPPGHFDLPWQHGKHPRTGLDRRSVIKCFWQAAVPIGQIDRKVGFVPPKILHEIAEFLAKNP